MNAEEARKRTLSITETQNDYQYRKIMDLIEQAVSQGKFEVRFYESLLPAVKLALDLDKYIVTSYYDRDGNVITIEW